MVNDVLEIEDEKFEQLLADKQHKQLMGALHTLVYKLSKDAEGDKKSDENISQLSKNLVLFLGKFEAWQNRPEKELPTPQVTVNQNQEEVVRLLKLVIDELKNNKPVEEVESKEWEFKVIRGYGGNIEKVNAIKK